MPLFRHLWNSVSLVASMRSSTTYVAIYACMTVTIDFIIDADRSIKIMNSMSTMNCKLFIISSLEIGSVAVNPSRQQALQRSNTIE